jgi:hypothetical protein
MKSEGIAKVRALRSEVPFRAFQLQKRYFTRYRITRRAQINELDDKRLAIWSRGQLEVISYEDLDDGICYLPPWETPWRWLYEHPLVAAPGIFLLIIGFFVLLFSLPQSQPLSLGPIQLPSTGPRRTLSVTSENQSVNTPAGSLQITTLRTGDFFTRVLTLPNGQAFVESGYVNSWGEMHVERVAGSGTRP